VRRLCWQAVRSRKPRREKKSHRPLLLDSVPASSLARPAEFGVVAESQKAVRVVCSPFGDDVAFAGDERLIYLWNFNSRETRVLDAAEGPMSSLAYSPNVICSAHEGIEQAKSSVRVRDCANELEAGFGTVWRTVTINCVFCRWQESRLRAQNQPAYCAWNLQTGKLKNP